MRLSVDRDVKRLFDNPVVLPLVVLGMVVVGGILRLVVARQDLFGDELATYWVVSTRGAPGGRRDGLDHGRDHPAVELRAVLADDSAGSQSRAGPPARAGRRDRGHPTRLRGGHADRWPQRRGARRGAHDAQPVHDLLLGRGARLRPAHGAAPPVDPGPAAGHRHRQGGLVGALRPVRLPGRVHALHRGVRAGRPAGVGGLGPPAVPPARVDRDGRRGAALPPVDAQPQGRRRLTDDGHPECVLPPHPRRRPADPGPLDRWLPVRGPDPLDERPARDARTVAARRQPRSGRLRDLHDALAAQGVVRPERRTHRPHRGARTRYAGRQPPAERRRRQRLQHPQPGRLVAVPGARGGRAHHRRPTGAAVDGGRAGGHRASRSVRR